MIKVKIIPDFAKDTVIAGQIIKESKEKWQDQASFLIPLLLKAEIAAIALKDSSIIAFSLARKIIGGKSIAVAFLATRVLAEYRNKGIAKTLVKRVTRNFIFRNKFLDISNWFKPVYFVTATANPIVFESSRKYFKIYPFKGPRQPSEIELSIAESFAEAFLAKEKFNKESFVLGEAFLNSAEFYAREEDIPWSDNQTTNAFLEERIKLK